MVNCSVTWSCTAPKPQAEHATNLGAGGTNTEARYEDSFTHSDWPTTSLPLNLKFVQQISIHGPQIMSQFSRTLGWSQSSAQLTMLRCRVPCHRPRKSRKNCATLWMPGPARELNDAKGGLASFKDRRAAPFLVAPSGRILAEAMRRLTCVCSRSKSAPTRAHTCSSPRHPRPLEPQTLCPGTGLP